MLCKNKHIPLNWPYSVCSVSVPKHLKLCMWTNFRPCTLCPNTFKYCMLEFTLSTSQECVCWWESSCPQFPLHINELALGCASSKQITVFTVNLCVCRWTLTWNLYLERDRESLSLISNLFTAVVKIMLTVKTMAYWCKVKCIND